MGFKHKKWSPSEQVLFLELYCSYRRRGMGKQVARIDAQERAIEKSRHFAHTSLNSLKALPELVQQFLPIIEELHVGEGTKPWAPPGEPAAAEVTPKVVHVAASSPEIQQGTEHIIVQHFLRSSDQIAKELVSAIKAEVTQGLREYILTEMDLNFNKVLDYLSDPNEPDTKAKITIEEVRQRKRIVVVGLLPQQFDLIKRDFPHLRLANIESNHVASKLRGACYHAELVLIMRDWVDHNVERIPVNANVPYEWVSGTMTSLRNRLKQVTR